MIDAYALSLCGSYPYLICTGRKKAEIRSWQPPQARLGSWVLLHKSATKGYESTFLAFGIQREAVPDRSFIGMAYLEAFEVYDTAKKWFAAVDRHLWGTNTPYEVVRDEYHRGKAPVGHIFSKAFLFQKPIMPVRGMLGYWKVGADIPDRERLDRVLAKLTNH